MISKKICLLGAPAVGKTSLVRRFVDGAFSDRYLTTVGVKVDKKVVETASGAALLMVWDLAGEDEFASLQPSYLRGSAGYLLVADGTRASTLERALEIHEKASGLLPDAQFSLLINKADLEWQLSTDELGRFEERGSEVIKTSAKTGAGVQEAFEGLASRLLSH